VGKRLYKTYLREQLRYWKKKLLEEDNPYKKNYIDSMVKTFKKLIEKYRV
jgi:hypothetical protein